MSDEKMKTAASSWVPKDLDMEVSQKGNAALFAERIQKVDTAISLKESNSIPVATLVGTLPYVLDGTSFKASMYDYPRASQALINYYQEFQPDATMHTAFTSGRANEIAQSSMIDWPGRPGTRVSDSSTHQVIEQEYLSPEEYPEILKDFTGFMLRKYIPRAYPALKGLADIRFVPSIVLNTTPMASLYSVQAQEAFATLAEIGKEDAKAAAASKEVANKLAEMGFPPFMTGAGEAPFDIIGDYYRGTLGALTDQLEYEDELAAMCDMLADIQIESYAYFNVASLPVKRVFFPLHKGMDGFMSPQQYEKLYWKPLKKIMMALIEMGVTPFIYTEGKYNTRLEQLADVPKGKVIYHFETVDMKEAKRILGDVACISGNLPIYLLEYGTKEQVVDHIKYLIDTCAPGGGYIFDTNAGIDNAKRENIEVMFDTLHTYGRK